MAENNTITPGWKTSEFWLNMIAVLLGAFVNSGLVPVEHWSVKVAGIALAAFGVFGYTSARKAIKLGALVLCCLVGLSACATTPRGYLAKALVITGKVDAVAIPEIAKACKAKPLTLAQCAAVLHAYEAGMDSVGRGLDAANKALIDAGVK